MPRRKMPGSYPRRDPERPRDPRPGGQISHVVLVSAGLALYLVTLWFGLVVVRDDNMARVAIMAGLIVAIAAAGYVFTRQPTGPRRK